MDGKVGERMNKVSIEISSGSIFVSGDTYAIKGILKKYGFKWNSHNKVWHRTIMGISIVPALVKTLRTKGVEVELPERLERLVENTSYEEALIKAKEDEQKRYSGLREAYRQKRLYGE